MIKGLNPCSVVRQGIDPCGAYGRVGYSHSRLLSGLPHHVETILLLRSLATVWLLFSHHLSSFGSVRSCEASHSNDLLIRNGVLPCVLLILIFALRVHVSSFPCRPPRWNRTIDLLLIRQAFSYH